MKAFGLSCKVSQLVYFFTASLFVSMHGVVAHADIGPKLAVIDAVVFQQKLLVEVNKKLEEKFKSEHDSIQKLIEDFNKDNEKLKKDKKILTPKKAENMREELQVKQLDLQKQVRKYEAKINLARQEELKSRLDKLTGIVKDISSANQYDMVLAKNITLYVDPKFDITDQIAKKYDEVSGSSEVKNEVKTTEVIKTDPKAE